MRIVQIDALERKLMYAEKALAEVSMCLHNLQEALNEYENKTKEVENNTPPFD
jgi:hypothetical protein